MPVLPKAVLLVVLAAAHGAGKPLRGGAVAVLAEKVLGVRVGKPGRGEPVPVAAEERVGIRVADVLRGDAVAVVAEVRRRVVLARAGLRLLAAHRGAAMAGAPKEAGLVLVIGNLLPTGALLALLALAGQQRFGSGGLRDHRQPCGGSDGTLHGGVST